MDKKQFFGRLDERDVITFAWKRVEHSVVHSPAIGRTEGLGTSRKLDCYDSGRCAVVHCLSCPHEPVAPLRRRTWSAWHTPRLRTRGVMSSEQPFSLWTQTLVHCQQGDATDHWTGQMLT